MTPIVLLVLLVTVVAVHRVAWRWTGGGTRELGRPDVAALWRRREQERHRRRERARQRRLPPLPADDTPPAGLRPLVPSPRVVRGEVARGLAELELWLSRRTST